MEQSIAGIVWLISLAAVLILPVTPIMYITIEI